VDFFEAKGATLSEKKYAKDNQKLWMIKETSG